MIEAANQTTADLLSELQRTTADYDWPRVVDLSTQILKSTDLPPETAVDALRQRARAHEYMGQNGNAVADLKTAVSLARANSLSRHHIQTLNQLSLMVTDVYGASAKLRAAMDALALSQKINALDLQAESHLHVAMAYNDLEEYGEQQHGQRALSMAQKSGDRLLEARSCLTLAVAAVQLESGNRSFTEFIEKALVICQKIADRPSLTRVHLMAGWHGRDLTANQYHNEQALQLAGEIKHRRWQAQAGNNLAYNSLQLGLFHGAEQIIQEVLKVTRIDRGSLHAIALGTLVECYLPLGKFDRVPALVDEINSTAESLQQQSADYTSILSGLAALGRGDNDEAVIQLQSAVVRAEESGSDFLATALSWLGAAQLAAGDKIVANENTNAAISLTNKVSIYTPQEIWWWHYQTTRALASEEGGCKAPPVDNDQYGILDRARRLMLAYIGNISDEGLRRNYLNKVSINRDITLEWVRQTALRGESLAPFTERETTSTSFAKQFQRLVETGNRLTAQRDPRTLPDTIRNEFVELSGAERAIVALRSEDGSLTWAACLGLDADERDQADPFIGKYLSEAQDLREPVLHESEGTIPDGGVPELHLRSVIALPLISQGKLWGVFYGDMRHIFGRFSEQDLSLLNLLANQAAAALENANWVQGLEQQVAERTAELAERVDELQIINSIQQGLAAELDFQSIIDLVGDKLREVFNTPDLAIAWFDEKTNLRHMLYFYEHDVRLNLPPRPLKNSVLLDAMNRSRRPLVLNTVADMERHGFGSIPGTDASKSSIFTPIISGDRALGFVSINNFKRENAFGEAEVRLLTTVTASLGSALENARLFDETQRLYTEAEEAKQTAEEAQQLAEEANAAKSSFLASMSHELRTPLNAIIGFTRIVKRKVRGQVPEKQVDNLGKVLTSAEHLLGLINTVLDLAKIEAGRMDVLPSEFVVEALIEMCLATAQPLARPGVQMVSSVPPDIPTAYSDQDKIRQILLNLLSNAAKFTHEGEIVVEVSIPRPPLLQIKVTDTGIGMNKEQLARVFEEFQQAKSTTSRDYGGTGLGLPISKQLAQILGGDLTAASQKGRGSTFTLELPLQFGDL